MTRNLSPNQFVEDIQFLCEEYAQYNHIAPEIIAKYPVKKGLRNQDGTGVLAGITKICNVHGYLMNESEKLPIDGELIYRGYRINDLIDGAVAEHRSSYEEACYLLLLGHLPSPAQMEKFNQILSGRRSLPHNFTEDMLMKVASPDIMNMLARSVLALYPYDENPDDNSVPNVMRQSIDLIARMPLIMAYAYQVKKRVYDERSMYLHNPSPDYSTAENILRLLRSDKHFTPEEAVMLDICLTLHAEHGGGNNSTFAVRSVSSAITDTYSAIAAGIGALKGARHGGANFNVNRQLEYLRAFAPDGSDEQVAQYIRKALAREAGDRSGLIYGMGHAVYTKSDPRAVILKKYAQKAAMGTEFEPEFLLLDAIERLAPAIVNEKASSEAFVCANVDLYSGLIYRILQIPQELHTPLFACARTVGWCAHRLEEISTCNRIYRPAYKPIAHSEQYVPLSQR